MNRRGFLSSLLGAAAFAVARNYAPAALLPVAVSPVTLVELAGEEAVVRVLAENSALLADIQWIECNGPHRAEIRTPLPRSR